VVLALIVIFHYPYWYYPWLIMGILGGFFLPLSLHMLQISWRFLFSSSNVQTDPA
jgi:hypothetical protein